MYEYFRENYTWNLALIMTVGMGGQLSEIDSVARSLHDASRRNDKAAHEEWHQAWSSLGDRLTFLARQDEELGHRVSAGTKYLRAAAYYLTSERLVNPKNPHKIGIYRKMLDAFGKGAQLRGERLQRVEIPYEGKTLPAFFIPADGDAERAPCMVHFDGFDVMKELIYLSGMPREFQRRGISTLIVDHPGVGEALRLHGLTSIPQTERPAAAAIDYLETRPDVDASRIGIIALSLGGYYAPRAAAFEKRLQCCVAWGGIWDLHEIWQWRISPNGGPPAVSDVWDHANWVMATKDIEGTMAWAKQYTLRGVAEQITCPLLVVHGNNDRQIPLADAERTIAAAVNSPRAELKVFSIHEGGCEHCSVDNWHVNHDYVSSWVAEVFGQPNGPQAVAA